MFRRLRRTLVAASLLWLGAASGASAQSPWLPLAGQLIATPGFSWSTFDKFWAGDQSVNVLKQNGESLDQINTFVDLDYGILDRLAFDATLGWTQVYSTKTFMSHDTDGLADTTIGLRYRVLDEAEYLPLVTARIGGVLAGTYKANTPFSPGDGVNGFDMMALFGKTFGESGFGSYGHIGYRVRDDPAPDEFLAGAGVYKQFVGLFSEFDALTITAGYRHVQSTSGLDIGGPGFDPAAGKSSGFPALKEINQLFEGAIGYTDAGGRHYQFSAAQSVDGRNTGDKTIFGVTVSIPFRTPPLFGAR